MTIGEWIAEEQATLKELAAMYRATADIYERIARELGEGFIFNGADVLNEEAKKLQVLTKATKALGEHHKAISGGQK